MRIQFLYSTPQHLGPTQSACSYLAQEMRLKHGKEKEKDKFFHLGFLLFFFVKDPPFFFQKDTLIANNIFLLPKNKLRMKIVHYSKLAVTN